jgi:undecaprenyl-diphosphatase
MVDLSRPWPLGLGSRHWWLVVVAVLAVVAGTTLIDRPISLWSQSWPEPIHAALAQITRYGEWKWIIVPSVGLFVLTAAVAVVVRWRLMRTILWQFAELYAFFVVGVGLPTLATSLLKRLIGRGRPDHLEESAQLVFHPNWDDWLHQSFPSGHATTAFALFTVIGFLAPRWFYPGLVVAVAIAASRLSLGVHYPSDVLAGAVAGVLGAYVARWAFAQRRWVFETRPDGSIVGRQMSALRRYLILKRRGNG